MSLLTESDNKEPKAELIRERDDTGDIVIRLENVSVEYRAPREHIKTFKEYAIRLLKREVQHEEFRALRDVSLNLKRGEVFGIIGHNGAGKSTLLKIVSRVMKPTHGRIWVKGRIAPLLELGAGFHPELSGRENIFLNGTLLGYSKAEIKALFDSIVDFADLWDFIDSPLRTYSTGMAVRLGFAVATATRPDILIVDEVLSVGDEQFQQKCAARIAEFRQLGTTILLVTHDSNLVLKICDRAAWLDHGTVAALGECEEVVEAYYDAMARSSSQKARRQTKSSASALKPQLNTTVPTPLEQEALRKQWFYKFDLPSGHQTECILTPDVATIHETRWEMTEAALEPLRKAGFSRLTCLDVGCNQGYFSVKLAELGCRQVLGIDAREENIKDAELIQSIYGYDQLQFRQVDIGKITPKEFGKFDVVLLLGMVFQTENPVGLLRLVKSLARRVVIVESQLAAELKGQMEWGSQHAHKEMHGGFAVLDYTAEKEHPTGGLKDIALCPSREALLWTMRHLGFARVEVISPPAEGYEQFVSGNRILVAGYV